MPATYPNHIPMRNGEERDSHDGCDICREQREGLRPPFTPQRRSGRTPYDPTKRPAAPDFDPHIDYPERYTDGRPI